MIMDEPTNNLGVPEQHKVLELIRTLESRGVPVILITHVLPDAFAVTDRVIVMHRGRKVAEKAHRRGPPPRSSCNTPLEPCDDAVAGVRGVEGRRRRRDERSPMPGISAFSPCGEGGRRPDAGFRNDASLANTPQPQPLPQGEKGVGRRLATSSLHISRQLALEFREVAGDHGDVETAEDRLLRLAVEQEPERGLDAPLRRKARRKAREMRCGERDAVAGFGRASRTTTLNVIGSSPARRVTLIIASPPCRCSGAPL